MWLRFIWHDELTLTKYCRGSLLRTRLVILANYKDKYIVVWSKTIKISVHLCEWIDISVCKTDVPTLYAPIKPNSGRVIVKFLPTCTWFLKWFDRYLPVSVLNKNTKVLIIYSVILFVMSVIFVTLTAEYAIDELDMIIFVISDSKLIRIDVLF